MSESVMKNFMVKIKSLTTMVVRAHTMQVDNYGTSFLNLDGRDRVVYFAPHYNTEYCMEEEAATEITRRKHN